MCEKSVRNKINFQYGGNRKFARPIFGTTWRELTTPKWHHSVLAHTAEEKQEANGNRVQQK
jgi:hypothetical protein